MVNDPEPGTWNISVYTSNVPPAYRQDHEIGWTASIRHGKIQSKAWTTQTNYASTETVPIRAFLTIDQLLTDVDVHAEIIASGQTSTVPLYDDGLHGDGAPRDGLYGAEYSPNSLGLHVATVYFHGDASVAWTVPGEPSVSTATVAPPTTIPHAVDAIENFAFQVERVRQLNTQMLLDGMQHGGTWLESSAAQPDDLLGLSGLPVGSEADDEIACRTSTCRALGRGGDDFLVASSSAISTELHGGEGDDILVGGSGTDVLVPGPGTDFVSAGAGDDFVVLRHACELDPGEVIAGGEGRDTLIVPEGANTSTLTIAGFEEILVAGQLKEWSECK